MGVMSQRRMLCDEFEDWVNAVEGSARRCTTRFRCGCGRSDDLTPPPTPNPSSKAERGSIIHRTRVADVEGVEKKTSFKIIVPLFWAGG